jgi:hypothetical protein
MEYVLQLSQPFVSNSLLESLQHKQDKNLLSKILSLLKTASYTMTLKGLFVCEQKYNYSFKYKFFLGVEVEKMKSVISGIRDSIRFRS